MSLQLKGIVDTNMKHTFWLSTEPPRYIPVPIQMKKGERSILLSALIRRNQIDVDNVLPFDDKAQNRVRNKGVIQ